MPQDARKTSTATVLLVAALAILAGFAAVYGTFRGDDNAPRSRAAPAMEPASGAALPPGPGANSLSKGEMAAFVFKTSPETLPDISFVDGEGAPRVLGEWKGKVVLLNLWATWCAPCRKEMPSLDRLQKELGGENFEVIALAVDRAGTAGAKKFLDEIKVENLKPYADPSARSGAALKAVGMPATLIVNREGREIGRLVGPAEWDGEDARRLVRAAIGQTN